MKRGSKIAFGILKSKMTALEAGLYTPREASRILKTTLATVYSLSLRYKIKFKKAVWGEKRGRIDKSQTP
jgi:hypothetical protein